MSGVRSDSCGMATVDGMLLFGQSSAKITILLRVACYYIDMKWGWMYYSRYVSR